ncbi:bcl-2-binding component 3 [Micropterus salmoides]|uniref:bcl-2-binding component 3 n=1 Tax=Micropterus salmoides TaxID=27706 RepID=UPI0018EAB73C|nr:bcl-2-binding component 3 [Micropterus salmoides]
MARAETIESVGEPGGGGNTCRMGLPRPIEAWPGLLTTTTITTSSRTGIGAIHHNHHNLHPLQAHYVSYSPPYPHPEGQDEPQTHQQLSALSPSPAPPPSPLCNRRGRGAVAPSAFSGQQSDSAREEPLPDLLPQNEPPSWASPHHRPPRAEAVQELEVRRVADQLRAIGDEFNATVLHRAHAAPHWQDWREACRGLFNFITQTVSTLYRLT